MTKPDIVERLDRATEDFWSHTRIDVIREARAEIERLRSENVWLKSLLDRAGVGVIYCTADLEEPKP